MRASIVHNTRGEPRVLLEFESDEERELFKDGPRLEPLVESGELTAGGRQVLVSYSYTLEEIEKYSDE